MAGNNPVFANSEAFKSGGYATFNETGGRTQAPQWQAPQGQQPQYGEAPYGQATTQYGQQYSQQQAYTPEQLEQMYNQPPASAAQMRRMTYDDVVMRTGLMFAVLLATAAVSWISGSSLLLVVGLIGGLVLGLVNAFKKNPSPALILGYAAFEGLFIGGISAVFAGRWNGIVPQAVLATLAVFAVALFAYKSGKVRVTAKSAKIFMIALGGYLVFSLVNLVLMWSGTVGGDFGLRSGPLGWLIGLFAVGLAAYSLVMDFDFIDQGVRNGLPERFAWTAAFGLVVTLVWLYIEMLRLIAILRGDD
ncbi:MAG TPA: Bax inhibitor-1/YccA family protein [Actinomycetales bacterium]|nr:Bax inhibitor-1/YccA family protein [Actinomycetales bacterium]